MTLTKEQFLARISNAWDLGYCHSETLKHAERMIDAIHRLEGGQFHYFIDFMVAENDRTERFSGHKTLGNDTLGYNAVYLMAILTHPCQICAEDPDAWHSRSGFCMHSKYE